MKKIYSAAEPISAHFIKEMLQIEGIEAEISGERVSALQGGVNVAECRPQAAMRAQLRP
jgi:hypothetical protein